MLRFKPSRGLSRSSRRETSDPVTIAELQSLIAHGELEALGLHRAGRIIANVSDLVPGRCQFRTRLALMVTCQRGDS